MPPAPGSRLGPYEFLSPLGAGGMGVVWRARDSRLDREVAIKVLPEHVAASDELVRRFAREAKLLAALKHSGIATIHAFDEVEGERLLVMELAPGEGLDERMARGALPLSEALPIARQIAEALEEAHEHGIVHRDLKPANVKVSEDGRVKLLDFGLAKALSTDPSGATEVVSGSQLSTARDFPTVTGAILGTVPYMAPEQARGRAVDRSADVWAFGVVLWEMLSGRRLFVGETASDVIAEVLRKEIDFEAVPRETPLAVRRVLRRCLERDHRRRLRDLREARVALEGGDEAEPTTAASPSRLRARTLVVAVIAAACGTVGVLLLRPARGASPVRMVQFSVERPRLSYADRPMISPDGSKVAYVKDRRVRIVRLDDPEAADVDTVRTAGDDVSSPVIQTLFWSSDGANVAFGMEHKLWRVAAAGGSAPTPICDVPETGTLVGGDWSGDQIVLSVWRGGLYRISASGGRPEKMLAPDPKTEVDFHAPCLLPGGGDLLFYAHPRGAPGDTLEVLEKGKRRPLLPKRALTGINHMALAPTGHLVFDREDEEGIWALPFSTSNRSASGEPKLIVREGAFPSVSKDGTLLFLRGAIGPWGELVWVTPKGDVAGTIGPAARAPMWPAVSPDGGQVAVSIWENNQRDLFTYDLERGSRARLTATPELERFPRWSPAGERIVFQRLRSFLGDLVSISPSSGGDERTLAPGVRATFTPDGKEIVIAGEEGGGQVRLFLAPFGPDGALSGKPEPLGAPIQMKRFQVAPQGDLLAESALVGERYEVFVRTFPSGSARWQVSTAGADVPCWSSDGTRLFYLAGDDVTEVEVRRAPQVKLGVPRKLFSLADRRLRPAAEFDVGKDGRFLMVRELPGAQGPRFVVAFHGTELLKR